jgi:3-oxoacyl-[acyl-carrier protein] reductase
VELGLKNRRAVVTGGSKGIGLAIARELVSEGVSVAICARHATEVLNAQTELRALGGTVYSQGVDVTDVQQVSDFFAKTAQAFGGIDILVNNAGGAHPGTFSSLTDDELKADLEIKLFSQIRCARAALQHLRLSDAARIININSVYARYPDPKFFSTTLSRAACINFSKVLAIELGSEDILVNSVNIGFVVTPQWDNIRFIQAPGLTPEEFYASRAAAEIPLGRFGTVDEVAGIVTFLASDRASYITGASIDVAGGMGKYI